MIGVTPNRSDYNLHLDDPHGAPRPAHPLVTADDAELARRCGMDARDVSALRQFASERFLLVVRCPRTPAAAADGGRRAKPRRPRPKTGAHRVVVSPRAPAPPPLELMSVWKIVAGQPTKVPITPRGDDPLAGGSFEAAMIVLELNSRLLARVARACRDDEPSATSAVVAPGDRFVAFGHGGATFLPDAAACAAYYREHGLDWPHER